MSRLFFLLPKNLTRSSLRLLLSCVLVGVVLLSGFPVNVFLRSVRVITEVQADSLPHVGFYSPERVWTSTGNGNLNLRQPDPRSGDLLVAAIAIRPSASTVNTPSGWTLLGSWTGTDGGAEGVDAGSVSVYWFYKVANGTEGTANQTFTENGTTSVWIGSIMQLRSATGTYDISAGGYSINGDTTNWNGTLDTDIGLTEGDVALVFASQNGNLANSSAWNITATGITSKSTVREHGEFASTTGNDIEVGLATTHIWTGTNTATPAVTLTQSVASSGSVAAVRVRQGSGTNRSDTWVRSAGAQVAGSTSVAVPYPEHEVGDMLVLFVGNRYDTATPATPTNWTSLGTFSGGVGTNGADSGTARITAFYREATSLFTGTQSVTVTSGNTSVGQMVSVHKDDVVSWTLDSDGGSDNTAGTAWSVTGSGIDLDSSDGGDIVLVGNSVNTDARLFSAHALSATGITFGDVTETAEFRSTTGNDMTLEIVTGRVNGGSGLGVAPTFTMTANGSATNNPAGAGLFIKVIGTAAAGESTFTQNAYRFYVDNDGTNPGDVWGNPDLAENTTIPIVPAVFDPPSSAQEIRLRVNITNGTASLSAASQQFKLQYKAGTDENCTTGSWTDVGGGQTWEYATSSVTDGTDITGSLSSTDVNGQYAKSAPTATNTNGAAVGQDIEYDFHIIGTSVADATRYSFRVVESDNTAFDAYSNCPTLTTKPGTSNLLRHGSVFSEETEQGFFW